MKILRDTNNHKKNICRERSNRKTIPIKKKANQPFLELRKNNKDNIAASPDRF